MAIVIAASSFDTKDRNGNWIPFSCNHASYNQKYKYIYYLSRQSGSPSAFLKTLLLIEGDH
jgi:hypothetical protein